MVCLLSGGRIVKIVLVDISLIWRLQQVLKASPVASLISAVSVDTLQEAR